MSKALYTIVYSAFFIVCNGCIVQFKAVILYWLIIISMEYKRLSDRRFCALKYNIVLQGSIFSSGGFLVCCGITILFIYKVLSIALFEPFKVVGVVVWQCVKIITRLLGVIVLLQLSTRLLVACGQFKGLVGWVVDRVWIGQGMRKRLRGLYLNQNRWFCDSILTDLHTLTIHITVYLIPVFQII